MTSESEAERAGGLPESFSEIVKGLRPVDLSRVLRAWDPESLAIAVSDGDEGVRDRIVEAIRIYAEERVHRFLREFEDHRTRPGDTGPPARLNRETARLVRYTQKLIDEREIYAPGTAPKE